MFVGCSESDIDVAEHRTPIAFSTQDNWDGTSGNGETKSAHYTINDTFENSRDTHGIGVTAFYLQNGTADINSLVPNFMYDQSLTYAGGTWTYSPIKYWPTAMPDKVQFFAYWPYCTDDRVAHYSGNDAKGYPKLKYKAPEADLDLLGANIRTSHSEVTDSRVVLPLKHLLAKVNFAFIQDGTEAADYNSVVSRVRFINPIEGVFTFGDSNSPGTWTEKTNPQNVMRYTDPQGVVIYKDSATKIDDFTCYILPNSIQEFYVEVNNIEVYYKHTAPIEFKQGQETTLTFHLNRLGKPIFIATHSLWADGESFNGEIK